MIAALYGRKSTEDERSAEDGKSIDRQVALGRAFAEKQGWMVGETFTDDGISGADFTRPGLVALLDGARAKKFGAVVIMSLDRLGREQVRTAGVVQSLHEAGVEVWCYSDGQRVKFGKAIDKFMVGVHGFGAEQYRESVREKVIEQLRAKAARGHHVNGRTYGYTRVRVGDHTEKQIEPEQAAVVRRIFEMSASGLGDDRIATKLLQDGAPAPGKAWTKRPVAKILSNPIYLGRVIYGRTKNTDDGGAGKRVRTDASQWIEVEQPDLRIVSDDLWSQVQTRKESTRQHYLRGERGTLLSKPESGLIARHMLSGLLRCAECGGPMTFVGRALKRRYYCLTRAHKGAAACSAKGGVPMDALDRAVIEVLLDELLSDKDRLWSLISEHDAKRARSVMRKDTTKERARLEKEIANLVAALATGKATATVTAEIEKRESALALLTVEPEPEPVTKEKFLDGYAGFRITINQRHPQQVRALLRKLGCTRIVVKRTGEHAWDFEGEFDLGRVIETVPPTSSGGVMRLM